MRDNYVFDCSFHDLIHKSKEKYEAGCLKFKSWPPCTECVVILGNTALEQMALWSNGCIVSDPKTKLYQWEVNGMILVRYDEDSDLKKIKKKALKVMKRSVGKKKKKAKCSQKMKELRNKFRKNKPVWPVHMQ